MELLLFYPFCCQSRLVQYTDQAEVQIANPQHGCQKETMLHQNEKD